MSAHRTLSLASRGDLFSPLGDDNLHFIKEPAIAEDTENSSSSPEDSDSDSGDSYWRNVDRYDIMCRHLYLKASERNWFDTIKDAINTPSVVVRVARIDDEIEYRVFPPDNRPESAGAEMSFAECLASLNIQVALRVSYPVVNVLISALGADVDDVELSPNCRIQVLDTVLDLQRARKYQYAAYIKDESSLILWADSITDILPRASDLEKLMLKVVWETDFSDRQYGKKKVSSAALDAEKGGHLPYKKRPVMVLHALCVGVALMILFTFFGLFFRTLATEIKGDGGYHRLAAILYLPPFSLFCAFFCVVVSGIIFQLFGPVSQMLNNSANYSAVKPKRISPNDGPLPHITIQCPIYKESLEGVIDPTMKSVLKAIATYELQGGTANIFANEDGMQLISEEEALRRKRYYSKNLIGWVARPPHGQDGFQRKGRFKKASNMNYCLHTSNRVEELLEQKHAEYGEKGWTEKEEIEAYEEAIAQVGREDPTCWLDGDIRVGDIILLIDCDTRVPEDCLIDAASEFHSSPDVAILQNISGVMMVVFNYWEDMIAWFTRLIYFAIQYGTAGGDAAAFVGHNAFLRWSAVQEVAYEEDGVIKYWSESHVSEDFEISLKLRCKGYTIRLASYHGSGFQEGVSLSVYDEITRWQKYAYGCSELMLKPVKDWWKGNIFTSLFLRFVFAKEIPFFAKFTVIAYIGTYYAIAGCLVMTLVNYFVCGWFPDEIDHFYQTSFNNFISCAIVFSIASPIAIALMKYRVHADTFWHAMWENFKWCIFMSIFLGGLSWHLTLALLSHMFSINMQWGSTAKELKDSNFFQEFPKIMKGFKWMYLVMFVLIIGMFMLAFVVPWSWRISGPYVTFPLGWTICAHVLSPIVLNPQLMTFSF
ncbi:glycosyl transferase family group 2-domain-containing protein [Lipomyces oligophaga]|uniref:glycosyl transferase family group 2-domain-containing protein n=1 Tax=Lipomyces oligophaga TaxID=45792 RepID=UPI0034CFEC07